MTFDTVDVWVVVVLCAVVVAGLPCEVVVIVLVCDAVVSGLPCAVVAVIVVVTRLLTLMFDKAGVSVVLCDVVVELLCAVAVELLCAVAVELLCGVTVEEPPCDVEVVAVVDV